MSLLRKVVPEGSFLYPRNCRRVVELDQTTVSLAMSWHPLLSPSCRAGRFLRPRSSVVFAGCGICSLRPGWFCQGNIERQSAASSGHASSHIRPAIHPIYVRTDSPPHRPVYWNGYLLWSPWTAINIRIDGVTPSLRALVRQPGSHDRRNDSPLCAMPLNRLPQTCVLGLCPGPFLHLGSCCAIPSLAAVFVCSPGEECSDLMPTDVVTLCLYYKVKSPVSICIPAGVDRWVEPTSPNLSFQNGVFFCCPVSSRSDHDEKSVVDARCYHGLVSC
jgi:hypothetical protein